MKKQAIEVMRVMIERGDKYEKINNAICDLCGDFSPTIQAQDHYVESEIVKLLDLILGHELASYFLYEARHMAGGGYIKHKDGKKWPIKTLKQVLNYSEKN